MYSRCLRYGIPDVVPMFDAVRLWDVAIELSNFAHQHRLCAAEVEQQYVADAMFNADAHAVRRRRIVGVQHVAFDAIDKIDALILSADVHVVAEHAFAQEFHAHTRGEVE